MKIVLGGATGFVGGGVLKQCLADERVTAVVALVRREVPNMASHSKLTQVVMGDDDFLDYPEHVRKAVEGADAGIWALGAVKFPNDQLMHRVSVEYPHRAAEAIASAATDKAKVRFVYVSGRMIKQDPATKYWFAAGLRRARTEGDVKVLAAGRDSASLQTTIVKPGFILPSGGLLASLARPTGMSIQVDELAASCVEYAVGGCAKDIVENEELVATGSQLLRKQK